MRSWDYAVQASKLQTHILASRYDTAFAVQGQEFSVEGLRETMVGRRLDTEIGAARVQVFQAVTGVYSVLAITCLLPK